MADPEKNLSSVERAPDTPSSSVEKAHEPELQVEGKAGAILESVDNVEDGSEAMGNISESASEGVGENRQTTSGKFQQFKQQMSDDEAKALKAHLLKSPPSKRKMIQEIRSSIHKEVVILQKQAAACERAGNFKELSDLVSRMRELKGLLKKLFHATADVIRSTWLKVVHGIG